MMKKAQLPDVWWGCAGP